MFGGLAPRWCCARCGAEAGNNTEWGPTEDKTTKRWDNCYCTYIDLVVQGWKPLKPHSRVLIEAAGLDYSPYRFHPARVGHPSCLAISRAVIRGSPSLKSPRNYYFFLKAMRSSKTSARPRILFFRVRKLSSAHLSCQDKDEAETIAAVLSRSLLLTPGCRNGRR